MSWRETENFNYQMARADEAYVVYRSALIEAGTKIDG